MDYLGAISELNYMTQLVIMLYEDNNKVRGWEVEAGGAWSGEGSFLLAYLPAPRQHSGLSRAGSLVRGEVPCGAALQPRCEGM